MNTRIKTQDFQEMHRHYDPQTGTKREFGNRQEARVVWAQSLQRRGYRPEANGIWLKPGFAAVMIP